MCALFLISEKKRHFCLFLLFIRVKMILKKSWNDFFFYLRKNIANKIPKFVPICANNTKLIRYWKKFNLSYSTNSIALEKTGILWGELVEWGQNSEITFSRKELVSDMGGTWKNKGADKKGLLFWPFMLQKAQPFWPCFCLIPLLLMNLEWKLYVSKCQYVWWSVLKCFLL